MVLVNCSLARPPVCFQNLLFLKAVLSYHRLNTILLPHFNSTVAILAVVVPIAILLEAMPECYVFGDTLTGLLCESSDYGGQCQVL